METDCAEFLRRILDQVDELEREIGRTRADWQEKKGTFHDEGYVYRENLALLDEELRGVHLTRAALAGIDPASFPDPEALRRKVLEALEERYHSFVLMRSGIAVIMNLVRRMPPCR
jgi:hypothetical protein